MKIDSEDAKDLSIDIGNSIMGLFHILKYGKLSEVKEAISPLMYMLDSEQKLKFIKHVLNFRENPSYLPDFSELGDAMDWCNKIFNIIKIVTSPQTIDEKAMALEKPVFDIIADLIIDDSPLAVIANMPIIGPIFKVLLKESSMKTGDYVGGKLDNFWEYFMTKSGGKKYIINNKAKIRTLLGLPPLTDTDKINIGNKIITAGKNATLTKTYPVLSPLNTPPLLTKSANFTNGSYLTAAK